MRYTKAFDLDTEFLINMDDVLFDFVLSTLSEDVQDALGDLMETYVSMTEEGKTLPERSIVLVEDENGLYDQFANLLNEDPQEDIIPFFFDESEEEKECEDDGFSTEYYSNSCSEDYLTEPLPEWAARKANPFEIEVMSQLLTKDGGVFGNAVLFDITFKWDHYNADYYPVFHAITDAGNIIKLTLNELKEWFYRPDYIMNDFPNNEDGRVDEIIQEYYDSRY